MRNPPPDYLTSRLSIIGSNKCNVPYGWELPDQEDDQILERPRSEPVFFKVALISISVLLACLVFNGFGQTSTF